MKAYLVTQGRYSDYTVLGVYSSEERAKEALELTVRGDIEEFEMDSIPPHPPGMKLFSVHLKRDGTMQRTEKVSPNFDTQTPEQARPYGAPDAGWTFYIWARDEAHAIKIASERRTMMLASGEWSLTWEEWLHKRA